jgi:hypothetical protein
VVFALTKVDLECDIALRDSDVKIELGHYDNLSGETLGQCRRCVPQLHSRDLAPNQGRIVVLDLLVAIFGQLTGASQHR